MMKRLYNNRFEFFLATQLLVLFASLFFPVGLFEERILPTLFLLNIVAGINLVSKKKALFISLIVLFVASFIFFGSSLIIRTSVGNESLRLAIYFIFHLLVAVELIRQVWRSVSINRHVIFGLMSGYISLGFLGFFIFASIELLVPGSFMNSLAEGKDLVFGMDSLMYSAFITLLTIGYGEILPVTPMAQKASIMIGLMGQFYLVILTAIIVGKYLHGGKMN